MFAAGCIVYNALPLMRRTLRALFGGPNARARIESLARCDKELKRIPGVESRAFKAKGSGELVAHVTLRVSDGVDDAVVVKAARGVYNATVGATGGHVDCTVYLERDTHRGREDLPK